MIAGSIWLAAIGCRRCNEFCQLQSMLFHHRRIHAGAPRRDKSDPLLLHILEVCKPAMASIVRITDSVLREQKSCGCVQMRFPQLRERAVEIPTGCDRVLLMSQLAD